MKIFVCIFALAAIASADFIAQTNEQLAAHRQMCIDELHITPELAEKFKTLEYPDEESVRCYVRCTGMRTGIWTDEHGYNTDHVVEQLSKHDNKDHVRTEVEKCIDTNEQKSDTCTWAYRNFKCFLDANLFLVKKTH